MVLIVSLALHPLSSAGQTPAADSLDDLLRTHPGRDTMRVRWLQALAQALKTVNARRATEVSQQTLGLAQALHDATGQGEALLSLSNLFRRQSDYVAARRAPSPAVVCPPAGSQRGGPRVAATEHDRHGSSQLGPSAGGGPRRIALGGARRRSANRPRCNTFWATCTSKWATTPRRCRSSALC